MDNLTHSIVGAVLGQAGLKRTTGLASPALIIGANLPDVDAACFFWLEGTEHLAFRRGITHGPPALVLLPLILAGLLWGFDRWQTKRGIRPEGRLPVRFGWLYGLAFIGCLAHPALDWLNVYGIRLLEPFSSQWFYGDTLFIIDVWLWAVLIASVWWSRRREKAGADWVRPARVGIAVGLAYIGMNGLVSATHGYHSTSRQPGAAEISSPLPFLPFAREEISGSRNEWYYLHDSAEAWVPFVKPEDRCEWPDFTEARRTNTQLDAFLFWSRAPFATSAPDGSVILYDARFYDPRARGRFSVALPDVRCEELTLP
ncbi:MAG: metal-dependent hydrolase [Alphaproteobacteria bacterium HGW-Alphaproteobacteria-7]|jgi:inner membrane protein|nr:MAG: metal-dependent hydrolase [Alphaproteobacteria bacterium HGW-Alphaproteobacteria-7]